MKEPVYILGLNLGHNSTAALLKDGKIIGCVSEERFSRIKNQAGLPLCAIKYLLKENNLSIKEIDLVISAYIHKYIKTNFVDYTIKSIKNKSFFEKTLKNFAYYHPRLFEKYYSLKEKAGLVSETNFEENAKYLSNNLNLSKERILIVNHHLLHAFSTISNLNPNKKTLIFTLDGEGEGLCATVNIWDGKNLKVISKSKKLASIGYLYFFITFCLGMRPGEHEFKVMGLAPYAKKDKVEKLYNEKFKDLIWINENLEFKSKFNMVFSDVFFQKELKFERFDNIAGAVQKLTEELTQEWIRKAIKKTGIHNIALSGGVFMNVKANQKIAEMPEVKNIFIMPSCGDEANAIGACFYGYKKYCEEHNLKFEPIPIEDLYLGPEYGDEYIGNLIKKRNLHKNYKITKFKNINKEVAKLLAKGYIVARCSGRSEWGARALGNRSILSNASSTETIRILNETIKDRDFWMPFTPSILDKYFKKYVINPKNIFAPYMCITFNSTDEAKKVIPAAMHPYDKTIRPQQVTKEYNPDYYEIIEEYSKLTGIGGILNTSFNLHGEPNVLTPEDAIHTVENSDLKYLVMSSYLFEKKNSNKQNFKKL